MRLKSDRLKTIYLYHSTIARDSEGGTYQTFSNPVEAKAETWPGDGQLQQQMYGERLPNVRSFRIDGSYEEVTGDGGKTEFRLDSGALVTVSDGISFSKDEKPDYIIRAVYPYRWLTVEAERWT